MTESARVASVQIGRARVYEAERIGDDQLAAWSSAIAKSSVEGTVDVGVLGLAGDEQVDRKHHGGTDKAVLGYSAEHYALWRSEHAALDWPHGAFGENLTIVGLDESLVCVGDEYSVGSCILQVSQPRQPCWKLARRWRLTSLTDEVRRTGRTGWYYRVLQEGRLAPRDEVRLLKRPYPEISIAWAHSVMHDVPRQQSLDLRLAACPALAQTWRDTLLKRAGR
jgi:MOSC domain-containing protein YiiM